VQELVAKTRVLGGKLGLGGLANMQYVDHVVGG